MFSNLNYLKNEMIKNGLLKELEANDWLVYLAISAFANEIDLAEVNLVTLADITGLDMEDLEFSIFKLNQKKCNRYNFQKALLLVFDYNL